MLVNFREKIPKIGFFRPKWKLGVRYKINAILAYFEKKVQEVEKNTSIKVYEDIFFWKMHNLGNKGSFGFILYLTPNFHLGLKNPILGIFSRKFTGTYSFYV